MTKKINDMSLKEKNVQHGTPEYPIKVYEERTSINKIFVPQHWHEEVEIIYIHKGNLQIRIQGNDFMGKEGECYIINSGELHEINSSSNYINYYAVVFSLNQLTFQINDFVEGEFIFPLLNGSILFPNVISGKNELINKVNSLMRELIDINYAKEKSYQLGTKVILLQLLYLLFKNEKMVCVKDNESFKENKKLLLLKEILKYIDENSQEQITLNEISNEFHMSEKYFCKFFKDNFRKTFIEYLNDLRIEKAMKLLRNTDMAIMEVAYNVGFENFSYFIRRFKKAIGCTPSAYRKNEENVK